MARKWIGRIDLLDNYISEGFEEKYEIEFKIYRANKNKRKVSKEPFCLIS